MNIISRDRKGLVLVFKTKAFVGVVLERGLDWPDYHSCLICLFEPHDSHKRTFLKKLSVTVRRTKFTEKISKKLKYDEFP